MPNGRNCGEQKNSTHVAQEHCSVVPSGQRGGQTPTARVTSRPTVTRLPMPDAGRDRGRPNRYGVAPMALYPHSRCTPPRVPCLPCSTALSTPGIVNMLTTAQTSLDGRRVQDRALD